MEHLDGNAVAALLLEAFGREMTAVAGTCDNCGNQAPLGAVQAWTRAAGVVLRCPRCGNALIRIVEGRGRVWVNATGVRAFELPGSA